jgi:hypothetical protein
MLQMNHYRTISILFHEQVEYTITSIDTCRHRSALFDSNIVRIISEIDRLKLRRQ